MQAHPEYGADFIAGLIEHRGRGVVPDPLLEQAQARLDSDLDNARLADQITDFFRAAATATAG